MKDHRVPPTPGPAGNGAPGMDLPLLQISLEGVRVEVKQQPQGKLLVIGPVALVLALPFDTDAATDIGGLLSTGIAIPTGAVIERIGHVKP